MSSANKKKDGSKSTKSEKGKSSAAQPLTTADEPAKKILRQDDPASKASKTYCLSDKGITFPDIPSNISEFLKKFGSEQNVNEQAATFIEHSIKDNKEINLKRDELDIIATLAGTDVLEKYKNENKVFKTKDGEKLSISDLLNKQKEKKTESEADKPSDMSGKTKDPGNTSSKEKQQSNPDPEDDKNKRQIADLEKKFEDRGIELKEKDDDLEQLRKENQKMKEQNLEQEAEIKDITDRFDKAVKDHQKESADKTRVISNLEKVLEKTNTDNKNLQDERKAFEEQQKRLRNAWKKEWDEKYETDMRHKNEQIKEIIADRDDLRNRFSKLAGAKLTDQNPDIADLSDPNRAMKISEKFGQLYDDQWTDAFEYLKHKKKMSVKDAVTLLLEVLQKCEKFCTDMREVQMDSLRNVLLHPAQDVSTFGSEPRKHVGGFREHGRIKSEDKKAIKELRRQIGVNEGVLEEVKQVFVTQSKSWTEKKLLEGCTSYLQKCAEVCWLMVLHDPPLYMKFDAQHGETLDLTLYSVYSSSGKKIDFLVWPPLFNEKGGGLMSKGTAEPTKTVKKT